MNRLMSSSTLSKFAFTFLALFALSLTAFAQRTAVVDINRILETIAEYQEAQTELDQLAQQWRNEISAEYDQIKGMYNRYQAEQVLLSDDARRQREDEIMQKEKEVRDLQKEKFGPEGSLFRRRQELVRPIQDKVYQTIEEYASERGYDLIFDKGGSAGLIFTSSDYDKTDDILRKLARG